MTNTLSNKVVDTQELPLCPTPWCDHSDKPYVWQGPDDQYCVICASCQVEGPSAATEADAMDAWSAHAAPGNELVTISADELRKLRDEREKFMWQVRDTCTRAEKAEAALRAHSPSEAEVEALAERFKYEHRNACYPDATDFEARQAAEQFLAIAALSLPSDKTVELLREAREALKPFKRIADIEEQAGPCDSVMVNVSRCRDARDVLAKLDSHLGEMK